MTRGQYLFDLAHLCSLPPPQVDGLAMADFVVLLTGISQQRQAATDRKP